MVKSGLEDQWSNIIVHSIDNCGSPLQKATVLSTLWYPIHSQQEPHYTTILAYEMRKVRLNSGNLVYGYTQLRCSYTQAIKPDQMANIWRLLDCFYTLKVQILPVFLYFKPCSIYVPINLPDSQRSIHLLNKFTLSNRAGRCLHMKIVLQAADKEADNRKQICIKPLSFI